jgi:N-methylhydantoinase A
MSAYAVHEMVCENMASAARVHAVERGSTITEYTLIAFGGAAPLHAARVAEKIGVPRVIVPPNAGVGSAVGFLAAPVSYELVRSRHMRLDRFDADAANALLNEMSREATALVAPGARGQKTMERRLAYMRYVGQGHEITVALPVRALTAIDAQALRETFEKEYTALFARPIPGAAIEVLSWSVLVSTEARLPEAAAPVKNGAGAAPLGKRAFFDGRAGGSIDVPLYRREKLVPGAQLAGPAVIAEDETSTFVSSGFTAHVDAAGCIVMERKPA